MISLFFIEFIRVGGGERFRIDDSQSLDFIYDTASFLLLEISKISNSKLRVSLCLFFEKRLTDHGFNLLIL